MLTRVFAFICPYLCFFYQAREELAATKITEFLYLHCSELSLSLSLWYSNVFQLKKSTLMFVAHCGTEVIRPNPSVSSLISHYTFALYSFLLCLHA
jgi:hypothetical protein